MKFDMSAAWRDATAMMQGNREVLLIVAGIFFFLPSLISGLVMPDMQDILVDMENPEAMQARLLAVYTSYGWLFLLTLLAQLVGYLSLLGLLRDDAKPTVGEALKGGLIGLLPAIGTYLAFSIGVAIAFTALIALATLTGVPAIAAVVGLLAFVGLIYLMVKVSLSLPVIAIDKVLNPLKVLARSWKLTKGNSVRLFLFYLLIWIVYFVVAIVLGLVLAAVAFVVGATIFTMLNAVLSGLISAGVSIVFVSVLAAIHRQLAGPSAAAVSQTFD